MRALIGLAMVAGLAGTPQPGEAPRTATGGPAKDTPAAAPVKGPRIAVEPTGFDFGRVLPQKTLHKEFKIRNSGTSDLVIEGISTTCGCTVAEMETKLLKPGASTAMKVDLETRTANGKLVRSVLVRSNDPVKAVLEVKLEATVVPDAK